MTIINFVNKTDAILIVLQKLPVRVAKSQAHKKSGRRIYNASVQSNGYPVRQLWSPPSGRGAAPVFWRLPASNQIGLQRFVVFKVRIDKRCPDLEVVVQINCISGLT